MNQYDNTNRGSLFKNDRKESESHPDYKGSINVNGVEYWLSSWMKTSQKGVKFMSLSVKPKEDVRPFEPARQGGGGHVPAQRVSEAPADFDDSDSIPF